MNLADLRRSRGFTLIEIVLVLVLIGILVAVAVAKYFDLEKQARELAARAIIQEAQARMDALFATHLLNGGSCESFAKGDSAAYDVVYAITMGCSTAHHSGPDTVQCSALLAQKPMSATPDSYYPPAATFFVFYNSEKIYEDKVYFPSCSAK